MARRKQVAALPVRRDHTGVLQVLLVTSRESRRLVIPKGWPWPGIKDHQAAAEEAREEAGITGKMRKKSIGSYSYDKQKASGAIPVRVKVFLLEVEIELDDWPESRQRERIWCSVDIAAASVAEPELAALIRQHSKRHGI